MRRIVTPELPITYETTNHNNNGSDDRCQNKDGGKDKQLIQKEYDFPHGHAI